MDQINVVWKSYHTPEIIGRGYWDQGLLEDLFKSMPMPVIHHKDVDTIPRGQGAVFIINGRTHTDDKDYRQINEDIATLRWVLFIETGDEEAVFDWRMIKHPVMRFWVMLPRMNQHDDTNYKIPNGYRPETREVLKEIGYQQKKFDWFFAGQVNHERREQCVQELTYLVNSGENTNGNLITTQTFGEEKLPYMEYMKVMAQSKIVLCPSGIETPDNFRLYEALEAGCLPVVDAFSTKHKAPGFWQYLFGSDIPFPIVDYWDKLPKLMPELLRDYPDNANRCYAWWQAKKREMKYKIIDDIMELSK